MISNILLVLTWIFIGFGVLGIYRLPGIYAKLLTSSKIDTVAVITLLVALMIKSGFSHMTLKLVFILMFILLTNPIANHIIASSAYQNGIEIIEEK